MYKRIILLAIIAILVIVSAVLMLGNAFTKNAAQTRTVPPEIIQKFDENYPSKNLFPYRSDNLTADYKIEPKTIYIISKTEVSHEVVLLEIDAYLKNKSESIASLESKGVKFLFVEPTSNNTRKILD
ncbi:MAG TPA: hypothetical protein VFI61_02190 [Patescibacteria group bacterium]|nr:hypothetical protein [Patescibacteria group bacterium]